MSGEAEFPAFYLAIRRADNAFDEMETESTPEEITASDLQMIADALNLVMHARANQLKGFFEDMAQIVLYKSPGAPE